MILILTGEFYFNLQKLDLSKYFFEFFLLFLGFFPEAEADAEGGDAESEGTPEGSEPELAEPESKSLEEEIEDSGENSKELVRKARKIVQKSIDVSIGYVTHSISTGSRRKRQSDDAINDLIGE